MPGKTSWLRLTSRFIFFLFATSFFIHQLGFNWLVVAAYRAHRGFWSLGPVKRGPRLIRKPTGGMMNIRLVTGVLTSQFSLRDMIKSDGQWPQDFTSATLTSSLSNRLIYVMSSWLSPCAHRISFQVVSTTELFFSPMTLYYLLEFPVLANETTHFLRSKLSSIFSFSPPSVFNPRTYHEGSSSWHLFISSWPHS